MQAPSALHLQHLRAAAVTVAWLELVHDAFWCRKKKNWKGPLQYEDSSKSLMMLPTDMVRAFFCTLIADVEQAT